MKQYLPEYNKSLMSRVMGVTRQGFNKWLSREKSPQKQRQERFKELIADTYEEFEGVYGAPRITDELNELGYQCSENYIAKLMSELGIRGRNGKGFKYPRHALSMNNVSDNLLWRDFTATKPNEKWSGDGLVLASHRGLELGYRYDRASDRRCIENGVGPTRYSSRVIGSFRSRCSISSTEVHRCITR